MGRVLGSEYQVEVAATYEEALERVKEEGHFDGVVIGLYPRDEERGKTVLEKIRGDDAYEDTPVVAVCGPLYEQAATETLVEDGFDDTLQMPFSQSEFLAVVDGVVKGE